jgi:hypothetical protein
MNMNPEAPKLELLHASSALVRGMLLSRRAGTPEQRLQIFEDEAALALLRGSKCPDFVLDRGHWFGEILTPDEKGSLKAFLKTL